MTTRFADHLPTGDHASRPAAGAVPTGALYSCTTHSLIYQSDGSSTWSTWATLGAATTVATDAIWDAAGDLAVGTGADAAAKLAIGAAGGSLSVINAAVAWNSGTAFPANKATGDRYWRTDLGEEYYYDGTRWLSSQVYGLSIPSSDVVFPVSGDTYPFMGPVPFNTSGSRRDVWVVGWTAITKVATTNDGSNYWSVALQRYPSGTTVASFTTAADTADTQTQHGGAIGALLGTSDLRLGLLCYKTSAPGALTAPIFIEYRMVAT